MEYIKITFGDFMNLKSYCKLQTLFIWSDSKEYYQKPIDKPINDLSIIYLDKGIFGDKENYKELNFIDDFLLPRISKLGESEFSDFLYKSRKQFTEELRSGLAKEYIAKIRKTINIFKNSKFLKKSIVDELINQLAFLEQGIHLYISNPYPELRQKIQFNWKRTDVIVFFHLLRNNEIINHIEDSDLGRIIDNFCEYLSKNEYYEIKNSRKHLNNFKNLSRSENLALERIQNIFNNSDFYNV